MFGAWRNENLPPLPSSSFLSSFLVSCWLYIFFGFFSCFREFLTWNPFIFFGHFENFWTLGSLSTGTFGKPHGRLIFFFKTKWGLLEAFFIIFFVSFFLFSLSPSSFYFFFRVHDGGSIKNSFLRVSCKERGRQIFII